MYITYIIRVFLYDLVFTIIDIIAYINCNNETHPIFFSI